MCASPQIPGGDGPVRGRFSSSGQEPVEASLKMREESLNVGEDVANTFLVGV